MLYAHDQALEAAELLKIKPTTLNEMIKRYEIGPRRKKEGEIEDREERRSRLSAPAEFPAPELTRE